MSTRCNIHFNHGKEVCANIYRHGDGYPGKVSKGEKGDYGVLTDLLDFFRLLKAHAPDTRFNDALHLSGRFVVWQSQELTKYAVRCEYNDEGKYVPVEETHYLNFLGVFPTMEDHGDIKYVYEVDCDKRDREGFPAIRVKHVSPFGGPENKSKRWRTVYLCGKPDKAAA